MPVIDLRTMLQEMSDRLRAVEERDAERLTQNVGENYLLRENDDGLLVATLGDQDFVIVDPAGEPDDDDQGGSEGIDGDADTGTGGGGTGSGDCDCPPGPMGPEGPTGPTGDCSSCPPGEAGPEGDSAYQVAVDNGFVGTEAEWLASLVGPGGPTGPEGPPGTTFEPVFGSYTPVWTGTVSNPSLGNAVRTGRFFQAGDFVRGNIRLQMGSTTTYGSGGFRFTLPTSVRDSGANQIVPIGTCAIRDNSAGTNFHRFVVSDQGNLAWIVDQAGNQVNATTPMTWAQNDYLVIQFAYEAV